MSYGFFDPSRHHCGSLQNDCKPAKVFSSGSEPAFLQGGSCLGNSGKLAAEIAEGRHPVCLAIRRISGGLRTFCLVDFGNRVIGMTILMRAQGVKMEYKKTAANNFHQQALQAIERLLGKLAQESEISRAAGIIAQAKDIIEPQKERLEKHIAELERYATWDCFVIAFYGETNAGKSTIIEALRIALNEPTKMQERAKLAEALKKIKTGANELQVIAEELVKQTRQLEALQEQERECPQRHADEHNKKTRELEGLQNALMQKRQALSLWGKFLTWFRKLPQQMALENCQRQFEVLQQRHAAEKEQLNREVARTKKEINRLQAMHAEKEASFKNMAREAGKWADGRIIGTGVSDFTRRIQEYAFSFDGQQIKLLDIPGIEGQEQQVMDSISAAVKQAHAVFYVTSKAAAPQTGDENTEGTLEKIRKHLGDQTEVWSIYNKRITNPRLLLEGPLLGSDESRSLRVMDDTLRAHLGKNHYQGHIAVSAQPAFFALADFLLPGSQFASNRAKFMERDNAQSWLEKSAFNAFTAWFSRSMLENSQVRIHQANINKVRHAIVDTAGTIRNFQQEIFAQLSHQLRQEWESAQKRLDGSVKIFEGALGAASGSAMEKYASRIRRRMYDRIDDEIDNDAMRQEMQDVIEEEQGVLLKDLQVIIAEKVGEFEESVKNIITQFKEHVGDMSQIFRSSTDMKFASSFKLDANIDSGINYTGILSGLFGGYGVWAVAAANGWNAIGWLAAAIGAVGVIINLVKAVRGFFDKDYKKAQQRKAVEENLRKVAKSIESSMKEKCAQSVAMAQSAIAEAAQEIRKNVENIEHINSVLMQSSEKLEKLTDHVAA